MNKYIFPVFFICAILFTTILKSPYNIITTSIIVLIFVLSNFFISKSIQKRKFNSDLEVKLESPKNNGYNIAIIVIWALFIITKLLTDKINDKYFCFVILMGGFLINHLLIALLFKNSYEFSILIYENELIVNNTDIRKRNLQDLTSIYLNEITRKIIFTFNNQRRLKINQNDFDYEKLDTLLKLAIKKSSSMVHLSENLSHLRNSEQAYDKNTSQTT